MTLEEFGTALRSAREKRMLEIEEAASRLKISARILRAMEAGDAASLPPPAYTKGFLRTYAAFVGFSNEEILNAVQSLAFANQHVEPQSVYTPEHVTSPAHRFKSLFFLLLLMLAGASIFLAWRQGIFERLPQNYQKAQPAPEQMQDLGQRDTKAELSSREPSFSPVESETSTKSETKPSSDLTPSSIAQDSTSKERNISPTAPEKSLNLERQKSSTSTPENTTPSTTPHKVVITALEECWVHSSADMSDIRQFSLHKGDIFALTFTSHLELKLGNAGGVRLRYDGEEIPSAGRGGQVRTVSFPPVASSDTR